MSGVKHDGGKLRYDLLPADALEEVVRVYTMGADKYTDRNWEEGLKFGRVYAALLRHLQAWWQGEGYDFEGKQHHLSSVAWCALALLHYSLDSRKYADKFDDRPTEKEKFPELGMSAPLSDSDNTAILASFQGLKEDALSDPEAFKQMLTEEASDKIDKVGKQNEQFAVGICGCKHCRSS